MPDSILAQTFTDFELILVDDGTRDDCPRIMTRYAPRRTRASVRVHKAKRRPVLGAKRGLDIARGEYIAFVDSDDTVEPTMLADAVAAAERTGAQLVIYNYRLVTEDGPQGACLPMKDETHRSGSNRAWRIIFIATGCPMCTGRRRGAAPVSAAISSSDIISRHAPNDEVFAEDTLFSAMYLMHVHTLAALAKPYVNYLQRGDSLMGMIKPNLCRRLITLSMPTDATMCAHADGRRSFPTCCPCSATTS
ncbi:MAG: glycosyltransferase family 2 protein [Christensenellales bacterium]